MTAVLWVGHHPSTDMDDDLLRWALRKETLDSQALQREQPVACRTLHCLTCKFYQTETVSHTHRPPFFYSSPQVMPKEMEK